MSLNKKDVEDKNKNETFDLDKQNFWILVKAAYRAILPFVFLIILVYFLFTLFLTKVVLK